MPSHDENNEQEATTLQKGRSGAKLLQTTVSAKLLYLGELLGKSKDF